MKISRRKFGLSAFCGLGGAFVAHRVPAAVGGLNSAGEIDLPSQGNATPAFADAIQKAIQTGQSTLLLPAGEFHFWPDGSSRRFLHVSNNDDAVNEIVALLDGAENLHIKGQETRLIFHGRLTPFVLQNCSNIRLSNVVLDWEVPFHCEATVASVTPDGGVLELEIHPEFRFRVDNGQFYFSGEGFEQEGIKNILEFDAEKRETRAQVWDNFFKARTGEYRKKYHVTQLSDRRIRIETPGGLRSVPLVGNVMAVMPPERLAPAIFLEDSNNVTFQDVTIHHAGCMGLICQTSSDIAFVDSAVVPSGERYVSTAVDATHFVNCAGTLRVDNCDFSNHIDDAVNVHGIYVRIKSRLDDRRLSVEYVDHQQRGVRSVRPGDFITLADADSVNVYFSARVEKAEYENARHAVFTVGRELPETVREGDVINVLSRQANLLLRNNRIGKNRARGILVSTAGQVVVEGNHFHTPGSAIRISGGVDHWYESGPTTNILIRNNVFHHCKYGVWGKAVIDAVCEDSEVSESAYPFHGNITIVDNEFRLHTAELLHAYRVEHLIFKRNSILMESYKGNKPDDFPILKLEKIQKRSVSDNELHGTKQLQIIAVGET